MADGATLDDLREAVGTLEETADCAARVFGGAHPITERVGLELEKRPCHEPPDQMLKRSRA